MTSCRLLECVLFVLCVIAVCVCADAVPQLSCVHVLVILLVQAIIDMSCRHEVRGGRRPHPRVR